MITSELEYPILLYNNQESFLYCYLDEKWFNIADKSLLDQGVFRNSFIIDAEGKLYVINNVINKGWATLLWGYSPFFKGRQVKVEFNLSFQRVLSFQELKGFIIERITQDKSVWRNYGLDPDEIVDKIGEASTPKDLIYLLNE